MCNIKWFHDLFINEAKPALKRHSGADSAVPIEVASEAEMNALLETGEPGGVYKYTGATTDTYENGELYVLGDAD